jgi:hypothetical protein
MHSRRSQAPAHITSQADARSVPPRSSDVSCAILKRLGASDAAPASPIRLSARTAAPRLAPREPPPPATAPCASGPARSTHQHPCTAGARKHPLTAQLPADEYSVLRRISDVSCVILPRLGASDAAPAARISISARTTAPRLAPRKPPPSATAPRTPAPAHTTHHHPCTAGVRKHPLTAQLPADACSVLLRSSDVSCAILPRLGANDVAPAAPN